VIFNLVLYGSLLCLSLFLQQSRYEPVLATGPRPPMLAGLALAVAGAAVLAATDTRTSLAVIAGGSVIAGLVSLARPAMTAAVAGAAGPGHAGVASGVLTAARQSGGALGVALLGSLFASSALAGSGSAAPSLRVPLAFAGVLCRAALVLARLTVRAGPRSPGRSTIMDRCAAKPDSGRPRGGPGPRTGIRTPGPPRSPSRDHRAARACDAAA